MGLAARQALGRSSGFGIAYEQFTSVSIQIPGISSIQLYVISSQFCLKRAVIQGIASQL